MGEWSSGSAEETVAFGMTLGQALHGGEIICLEGDLGSGKTTLVKGIIAGAVGCDPDEVLSPTFTYMLHYPGRVDCFHFDLYRLQGYEDFLALGFADYLEGGGVCCIEWAERIQSLLPAHAIELQLYHLNRTTRQIRCPENLIHLPK